MVDCVVIVPEDEMEEAEAFLRADFREEPLDTDIRAETCPPDGDPPGIGVILYATLYLAPIASIIPALLAALRALMNHPSSLQPVIEGFAFMYLRGLLFLFCCLPVVAIGAGLLLRIIRGYRNGSRICRLIVKALLLLLLL
ncbi:MAG: hypothetical protein JWR15_1493 [Prosthecobacter sp.]|nr:hypothetical protein [Prosthecobacter sp.]